MSGGYWETIDSDLHFPGLLLEEFASTYMKETLQQSSKSLLSRINLNEYFFLVSPEGLQVAQVNEKLGDKMVCTFTIHVSFQSLMINNSSKFIFSKTQT
jgi:hypothetical protein